MARSAMMFAAGVLAVWCVAGCIPDELPGYVNDGKTVVTMALDDAGRCAFWTCDVATKTVRAFHPPEKREFGQARMIGGQAWVVSYVPD